MKKEKMLTAMVITGICIFTACNNDTSKQEVKDTTVTTTSIENSGKIEKSTDEGMMKPMMAMTERMGAIKMTGDLDNDFAALMIEHHQGAVDMSEMELAKGSNAEMKKMAETMVADHKSEIAQLKKFMTDHANLPEHKNGDMNHQHREGEENELSDVMKAEQSNTMQMTGNIDKDYAMMMKAHHENAIKMSKAEAAYGHHTELKKMAMNMSTDDANEVGIFEKYLSSVK